MRFIVIDRLDGAGKGTHAKLIKDMKAWEKRSHTGRTRKMITHTVEGLKKPCSKK